MRERKIYLQPLGFLRGCNDSSTDFKRLNGGDLYFSALKVTERTEKNTTHELVLLRDIDNFLNSRTVAERATIDSLLNNLTCKCESIDCRNGRILNWKNPIVQGVLNVTPDSFSDGGAFDSLDTATEQADHMIEAGADIIDVGGESTKPGAVSVSIEQEISRVIPVIKKVSSRNVMISIDSRNSEVMSAALAAGAHIINDVSALTHDPVSMDIVARSDAPVILMHTQGNPENMQDNPSYENAVLDIYDYLEERILECLAAGVSRHRLMIDPGIGFGKNLDHNLEILANVSIFHGMGVPVVLGVSRKRFIGELSGEEVPANRVPGSISAAINAVEQGVQIIRMHDVSDTVQAIAVMNAISRKRDML